MRNKALPSLHDEQPDLLEAGDAHHNDHIADISLRKAIDALARKNPMSKAELRESINDALRDPRPPMPAESVLAQLEERHRAQVKAGL